MGKTNINSFFKKVPTGQRPIQSTNPAEEVQPSTSTATASSTKVVYVTYNDTALKEWIGFNRSTVTFAGRHYKAQCIYCKMENISGRKDALARHKAICPDMPDNIKKMVSQVPQNPQNVPPPPKTIPELMFENMEQQDRSDWLLTMAMAKRTEVLL